MGLGPATKRLPLGSHHADLQTTVSHADAKSRGWWDICCDGTGSAGKPWCYSLAAQIPGSCSLLKVSAATLLVGLTAKISESGKMSFTLSIRQTGYKQFVAVIKLPLYQLSHSGGVQSTNKTPQGIKSTAEMGR